MTQRYDTYKDSGVQWLGEIPGHWGSVRVKNIFKESQDITIDGKEEQLSVTQAFGIIRSKDAKISNPPSSTLGWKIVKKGDIVFNKYKAHSGVFFASKYDGIVTFNYSVYNCFDNCYPKYYELLFHTPSCINELKKLMRGVGESISPLYTVQLYTIHIPLPPHPEQHAIVSYLDDKCGKIDEWIEKKQKEVELLGEMKQRVIADAVTRGLNPDVKMKATNIAWLPEVPEHWEMSKVSSHFRQRNEKVSDKDYPALSVSKQGVTPQLDNVALSNAEGASRKLVKVGDYAVNSRSDRKGSCGVSKYEGSVSLITIVLEPFGIDNEYIHHLFRSKPWVEEFYRNGRGIVSDLWTTNFQMMKGMYFPVPPLSEQRAIVSYINERTAKIDKMVENVNREIESLKEYKQRLISDVVTGQIKVC